MNKFALSIAFAIILAQPAFAGTLVFEAEEEQEIIIAEETTTTQATPNSQQRMAKDQPVNATTPSDKESGVRCMLKTGQIVLLTEQECAKRQSQ